MRTRNVVETLPVGSRFHSFSRRPFSRSPNYTSVSYQIESRGKCFLFFSENSTTNKRKQLVYFDHENVNSLCSCHHYVRFVFLSGLSINLLAFYPSRMPFSDWLRYSLFTLLLASVVREDF